MHWHTCQCKHNRIKDTPHHYCLVMQTRNTRKNAVFLGAGNYATACTSYCLDEFGRSIGHSIFHGESQHRLHERESGVADDAYSEGLSFVRWLPSDPFMVCVDSAHSATHIGFERLSYGWRWMHLWGAALKGSHQNNLSPVRHHVQSTV